MAILGLCSSSTENELQLASVPPKNLMNIQKCDSLLIVFKHTVLFYLPQLRWVLFLAIKYLLNNTWGYKGLLVKLHIQRDQWKQAFSYYKDFALCYFTMDLLYYKCEDRDVSWPPCICKNCSMRGKEVSLNFVPF